MKFTPETLIHYMKPAGFFFLKKPGVIRTILGSCVMITMYSRRTGIGTACHPVLPTCRDNRACYFAACRDKYKYVECVLPEMMRLFKLEGVAPDELEVKLFGGAEMITNGGRMPQSIQVGKSNVEMAFKKLQGFGIRVKSHDTGGPLGRRVFFDTATGDVWVKKVLPGSANLFEKKDFQKQILMQRDG